MPTFRAACCFLTLMLAGLPLPLLAQQAAVRLSASRPAAPKKSSQQTGPTIDLSQFRPVVTLRGAQLQRRLFDADANQQYLSVTADGRLRVKILPGFESFQSLQLDLTPDLQAAWQQGVAETEVLVEVTARRLRPTLAGAVSWLWADMLPKPSHGKFGPRRLVWKMSDNGHNHFIIKGDQFESVTLGPMTGDPPAPAAPKLHTLGLLSRRDQLLVVADGRQPNQFNHPFGWQANTMDPYRLVLEFNGDVGQEIEVLQVRLLAGPTPATKSTQAQFATLRAANGPPARPPGLKLIAELNPTAIFSGLEKPVVGITAQVEPTRILFRTTEPDDYWIYPAHLNSTPLVKAIQQHLSEQAVMLEVDTQLSRSCTGNAVWLQLNTSPNGPSMELGYHARLATWTLGVSGSHITGAGPGRGDDRHTWGLFMRHDSMQVYIDNRPVSPWVATPTFLHALRNDSGGEMELRMHGCTSDTIAVHAIRLFAQDASH